MPKYASRTRHFARRLYKRKRYAEKNFPNAARYLTKNFISPLENHIAPQKPRFSPLTHAEISPSAPAESLLPKHAPLLPHRTCPPTVQTQQSPESLSSLEACLVKWRRPTLPRVCSTIGAVGLNFSVRNGKRWNPVAITTGNIS